MIGFIVGPWCYVPPTLQRTGYVIPKEPSLRDTPALRVRSYHHRTQGSGYTYDTHGRSTETPLTLDSFHLPFSSFWSSLKYRGVRASNAARPLPAYALAGCPYTTSGKRRRFRAAARVHLSAGRRGMAAVTAYFDEFARMDFAALKRALQEADVLRAKTLSPPRRRPYMRACLRGRRLPPRRAYFATCEAWWPPAGAVAPQDPGDSAALLALRRYTYRARGGTERRV